MEYKDILEDGEEVRYISKIHLFVLTFPIGFTLMFGTIFITGSIIVEEFVVACYVMTALLGLYPLAVILLMRNTRFVVTNKRVIEQIGVVSKRVRGVEISDIKAISFHQSKLGKRLRFGDVMLKIKPKGKKLDRWVFKYMTKPHEFIINIQGQMEMPE